MVDVGNMWAKSNGETLEEHVNYVLRCMEQIKSLYPYVLTFHEWDLLEQAILFHDVGKIDPKFQDYLKGNQHEKMEFYHNMISGAFINLKEDPSLRNFDEEDKDILYGAIFFHHDHRTERDILEFSQPLRDYVKDCVSYYNEDIYWKGQSLSRSGNTKYFNHAYNIAIDNIVHRDSYIKIKGLLHRCDYAGSAHLPAEQSWLDNGMTLGEKTRQFLVAKYGQLRELQIYMASHKDKNLIVTAATGSGKTEAALLWLDQGKGFFTLPLKVSINNIYKRIHDDTIQYDPSVLLHSDALSVYAEQNDLQTYAVARQLSAPLTICTIDQLLKFAYKYNGSELQLATLSYSKLVVDEIQSYSPQLLGTIIYALTLIHQLGGQFAITTATFPKIVEDFLKAKHVLVEKSPHFYGDVRHRHCITLTEMQDGDPDFGFDLNDIVEQAKNKKVLVLVNTVPQAKAIYEKLCQQYDNVHLLHSMFLKKDRQQLEENIVAFGQGRESGIWISTQIVEASLDIDFDVLFTEMCSMDSLLQRMGRVFRSREYEEANNPNVYIIANRNGVGIKRAVIHQEIYDISLDAVKNMLDDCSCLLLQEHKDCDMKQEMIDYVYDHLGKESDYYQEVNRQIASLENLPWYDMGQKEAQELFRDIHSITVIPRSVLEERKEELQQLALEIKLAESSEERIKIRTKLYTYTVNIRYNSNWDIERSPCEYFIGEPVFVCNGTYDFDETKKSGTGFEPSYRDRSKPDLESMFI